MQPRSPGRWDPTVCPRSSHVLARPGDLSCPKICPALQPDSPGGSRWSLQVPTAPLRLLSPDSGPSFCRAALRAPQSAGGHTCPVLAASPCSQLPGMASAQVVRAHERRRKEVSLWSASSCDLGPPSLYLSLPATYGSFPLRSPLAAPPPPRPPITSAPVALLWIRVTRGEVRMQSPRLHSQRSDPGGHTVGPGNLNFYQASQWIGELGCRESCEHSEKHLIHVCGPLVKSTNQGHSVFLNI